MLNGGSMIWGFCVYFVYMIPLETDVLRKHRFQKAYKYYQACGQNAGLEVGPSHPSVCPHQREVGIVLRWL